MNIKEDILNEMKSPEGLQKLTDLAKQGKTMLEIANHFGIVRGTLYTWAKKYPEIEEAISSGKKVADDFVEDSLYQSCFGHMVKEKTVEMDPDGNIVKAIVRERYIPANVTAIQYWLSNRRNDTWKARQQLEVTGDSNLPIMFVNNIPNPYEKKDDDSGGQ